METPTSKQRLVAGITTVAMVEYIVLIWYATDQLIGDLHQPNSYGMGVLFACQTYLTLGLGLVAACGFSHLARHWAKDATERAVCTTLALALVPASTVLSLIASWTLDLGLPLAVVAGGTAPYFLAYAWLRLLRMRADGRHR